METDNTPPPRLAKIRRRFSGYADYRIALIALCTIVVVSATAQIGKVGINTTTPTAMLHVQDSSVLFAAPPVLPPVAALPPVSGAGIRMMWYADKGAFRVGRVTSNQWNRDSIGVYSFAAGLNTKAKGTQSIAMGNGSNALGTSAVAIGSNVTATGGGSMAIGTNSTASGNSASAFGSGTLASGSSSTAMGSNTIASGNISTAMGASTMASGNNSVAMGASTSAIGVSSTALGNGTMASGTASTAIGFNTMAKGSNSTAMGLVTQANGFSSLVLGQYNDTLVAAEGAITATTPLLIVGNGDPGMHSNALVVRKNGRIGIGVNDPAVALDVNGQIKISGGIPGNGKVLTSDASGLATWQTPTTGADNLGNHQATQNIRTNGHWLSNDGGNEGIFVDTLGRVAIGTSIPKGYLHVFQKDAVFEGPLNLPGNPIPPPVSGGGTRMMWYPEKGAFRVGRAGAAEWDKDSIGIYSATVGGQFNKVKGGNSAAIGGTSNSISGWSSFIGAGHDHHVTADYGGVVGGSFNRITKERSFIGGGLQDTINGKESALVGGWRNKTAGDWSFIGAGVENKAMAHYGFIGGGAQNTITGGQSSISGGNQNQVSGERSFIGGGSMNMISNQYSAIAGGGLNTISNSYGFAGGGNDNMISGALSGIIGGSSHIVSASSSCIAGGTNNTVSGVNGFAGGGSSNTASGNSSFIGGGINNTVSGNNGFIAGGASNVVSGLSGFAGGGGLFSRSLGETVVGLFSTDYTPVSNIGFHLTDRLFVVGNGASSINRSNALTILKNGKMGIGTETPQVNLHVSGGSDAELTIGTSGYLLTGLTNGLNIVMDNNEIMARNNGTVSPLFLQNEGGNISIGGAAASYQLTLSTNSAGKPTSNTWTIASDARLKENVHPYRAGLSDILQIHPVWFTYTGEAGLPKETGVGVLAQELQQVAPYMVGTWKHEPANGPSTEYLSVDNGAMMYMLINAVKEQHVMIQQLQEINDQLQARIAALEGRQQ